MRQTRVNPNNLANKFDFIEFPGRLTPENFKIGGPLGKAIIDFQREHDLREAPTKMFAVKVKIDVEDASASYFIAHKAKKQTESQEEISRRLINNIVETEDYHLRDRCCRILKAKKIELDITAPAKKKEVNDWNLDTNVIVKVSGITFNANPVNPIVSITLD